MKNILAGIFGGVALTAAAQIAQAAQPGFEGFYIGAKAGYNDSNTSGAVSQTVGSGFVAGEAGYGWAVGENSVLGVDVWADGHKKSVTGRDYGADLKLGGVDYDRKVQYYVKLGVAATHPGNRAHYGIGMEYKFDRRWGGLLEWTGDTKSKDAVNYFNNSYVAGVTYHF